LAGTSNDLTKQQSSMKKMILTFLVFIALNEFVYPCSAIVLKKDSQVFLAKNFDWTYREGVIIKNVRATNKIAYFTHNGEQARWVSKYGSVTFNQNGKEMPYGGMNEKGLVVEMLWLDLTRYNINEAKQYVNELEWIQYQLDNYESVQQVIDHLNDLKIYPIKGKIHYIMTDPTGESVIVEYLNGKPVAYKKEANTCQAITNNAVLHSELFKSQAKGLKKNNASSFYRYYQLEQKISDLQKPTEFEEEEAFNILKKVAVPKGGFKTMWSIVYNVNQKSISFFTDTHKEIKTISLSELDFNDQAITYFNLHQNVVKTLNDRLIALTEQVNYSFMSSSLMNLGFDEKVVQDISRHQFQQTENAKSIFADEYFHFEISIPLEAEKQTGFLAVMDSEQNFKKRKVVTGGYVYGSIGKGTFLVHIYGLKNGKYAMLAFIDNNNNRKLDFNKKTGVASEKYATFNDIDFTHKKGITFLNTSANFDNTNAKILINWK
jgi:penicillin V acylase-like amidase (Ntn superfamily)/uncharacterized protein (DUF2141 family)